MYQRWEDRLIAKVIWFSALTAVAVVIWAEVIGIRKVALISLVILGCLLRRMVYGNKSKYRSS